MGFFLSKKIGNNWINYPINVNDDIRECQKSENRAFLLFWIATMDDNNLHIVFNLDGRDIGRDIANWHLTRNENGEQTMTLMPPAQTRKDIGNGLQAVSTFPISQTFSFNSDNMGGLHFVGGVIGYSYNVTWYYYKPMNSEWSVEQIL